MLAKVTTPQFKSAVDQANNVTKRGAAFKGEPSTRPRASGRRSTTRAKPLITDPADRAMWPQFLKMISGYFPDPEKEYGLDADKPE